jgi:hypothetical protein
MASSYWIPLMLLGVHRYLVDRRTRWLVLFGASWLLQSLANLYMMMFGAVLVGLWVAYFGSRPAAPDRSAWRTVVPIVTAWVVASLPLLPILLTYRDVHAAYGLERALDEPLGYSTPLTTWFSVSGILWLWSQVLPDDAINHFPGATILVLAVSGAIAALRRSDAAMPLFARRRRWLAWALLAGLAASVAVIVYTMLVGPFRMTIGARTWLRAHDLTRGVAIAAVCAAGLWWCSPRVRAAFGSRSPALFYAAGTIVMAIFAIGPVVPGGGHIVFDPAPYRWLMALPGFDGLRIPSRFWMLGLLCLTITGGYAFRALTRRTAGGRRLLLASAVAVGLALDAWPTHMNLVRAPWQSTALEPADPPAPVLELPIGDGIGDAEATFRAIGHRRPVLNGVSGYDPPHYAPLVAGLEARDPEVLLAISSLSAVDVVVDESAKSDFKSYVSAVPGAVHLVTVGQRSTYRLPARPRDPVRLGDPLPIAKTQAVGGHPQMAIDGTLEAGWDDGPQYPDQWFIADLGGVHDVGGVTTWLGRTARDYPRRLAIDVSIDGEIWEPVWEGRTAAKAFLAAIEAPTAAPLRFAFPPRRARFVRLRQLDTATMLWVIAELQVHRPR